MENKSTHKGFMFFPYLVDMEIEDRGLVFEAYHKDRVLAEVRIIVNPKADNYIFLCDLPNTPDSWGGSFRGFLYKDVPKILGTFTYVKEASLPQEKIDGTYEMTTDKFSARGISLTNGRPQDGFYMEFETIK